MVGNGCKSATLGTVPDFMTPSRMTKKLEAKSFEFFDDLPIFETG